MPRKPERIPLVLQKVEEIWREHPDWRLGQLIENISMWADPAQVSAWDLEDNVLVAQIKRHLKVRKKLIAAEPTPPWERRSKRATAVHRAAR